MKPNREVKLVALERIGRELLLALGEDPTDDGLRDTPRRFANWWREFIEYTPGKVDTAFESSYSDQMIIISGMRIWSLCMHHLLPFYADIAIGYIPTEGKILGLSKFARIAHAAAHKLQVQEKLVHDIADELERLTSTKDIAVLANGHHLCMEMRGVKTIGEMTTSVMRGSFRDEPQTRAEFLRLV